MDTIGIFGTGAMGTDIAFISATSGFNVLLYDIDEGHTKKAFAAIQDRLHRYLNDKKISQEDVGNTISKIKIFKNPGDLKNASLIIENVNEDEDLKKKVFRELDKIAKPGAILATNTSSISITQIASATKRPEDVIGIHFLIPAHVTNVVELIPGMKTTRETVEHSKEFIKLLGKKIIEAKDFPGFILNRTLFPMINEAITLLYEGAGKARTIDDMMHLGLNLPMGPLALADMIGLDIVLAVLKKMDAEYGGTKFTPCPLLKQYVAAGFLGKKHGRGFYIY